MAFVVSAVVAIARGSVSVSRRWRILSSNAALYEEAGGRMPPRTVYLPNRLFACPTNC